MAERKGYEDLTTMRQAGAIPPPRVPLHFLPLLQPTKPISAPLERLPNNPSTPPRVAFTTRSGKDTTEKTSWMVTTHVFPSAYPRSHYHGTSPNGPQQPGPDVELLDADKQLERELRQRDMQIGDEQLGLSPIESCYPPNSAAEAQRTAETLRNGRQPQLWSCIDRIRPVRKAGDTGTAKSTGEPALTLFLAHANGFHKEIWEPALEAMIEMFEGKSGRRIDEIWSLDTFNSGDAGVLNSEALSVNHSWFDHARDIHQFLEHYLPEYSSDGEAASLLPRLGSSGYGRQGRKIVAIGHSHSGACLLMLNTTVFGLFDGQILIDPMVSPFDSMADQFIPKNHPLTTGALARRDVFKSRAAVEKYMATRPYFQAWDERVRGLHVRFGFHALPGHENKTAAEQPVTLRMSKWSESYTFALSFQGSWAGMQLLENLKAIDARWKAHGGTTEKENRPTFIHCIFSKYFTEQLDMLIETRNRITDAFSHASDHFTAEDVAAEHLVAMEDPNGTGELLANALRSHLDKASKRQTQKSRL